MRFRRSGYLTEAPDLQVVELGHERRGLRPGRGAEHRTELRKDEG